MSVDTRSLRTQLKKRRAMLEHQFVTSASQTIAEKFWQLSFAKRARRIGVYMSARGEIDCRPIIEMAWMRKKRIYVPILQKNQIIFAPLKPDSELEPNRFGILEPVYSARSLISARQLDVVVVPLLAFDLCLNRIGMGAGYYDRTFAFSKRRRHWRHPRLVGAAYSFQQVESLQPATWDVPLHCVITEKESFGSC
jgi:5-formyltetrahydrofolate cyclo-ligase